jgi:RHS repeat-associated protein
MPPVSYTSAPVSWGQGDTDSSIAARLAPVINAAAGSLLTATVTGAQIALASKSAGAATNYSVTVSFTDTQSASYPALFPSASFSAASTGMDGGTDAESNFGTIYSYQVPTGGYAFNGNLLQHIDSVMGAWNFNYDTLNRLITARNASTTSLSTQFAGMNGCWSYDGFGNRKLEAFSTTTTTPCISNPPLGTISTVTTPTALNQVAGLSYDAAGNVRNDGKNAYLYDTEGRICAVAYPNGSGGSYYEQYFYGADGARVAKTAGSSLSCAAPASAPTTQYLLGPGGEQVTELSVSATAATPLHTNIFAGGKLLATYDFTGAQGLHFVLADPLGTKRVQVGVNSAGLGTPELYCLSLPFGNGLGTPRATDCVPAPGATTGTADATEHHFTGKEHDTESGNDYFGARYYASAIGRWMSPDPTGLALATAENPQSLNLYAYVNNNPLSMIDPDGLQAVPSAYCKPAWLCVVKSFVKHLFSGGGGGGGGGGNDGGGGVGGGWSPTPYSGKNLVNVYYPHGAGTIGGHISVGTYDSEDSNSNDPWSNQKNAYGFTTVNQGWYVRTMLIVGWPFFKGTMEPDAHSPRSRKGAQYRYLSINDEGFANANAAINNHNGNYRFWLLPRNCANAAEDVDHAAGAGGIPHHEIFWPHFFWWLSPVGWEK